MIPPRADPVSCPRYCTQQVLTINDLILSRSLIMADHHDHGHDDPAVHQAPWVTVLTLGVCFGVTVLIMLLKQLA